MSKKTHCLSEREICQAVVDWLGAKGEISGSPFSVRLLIRNDRETIEAEVREGRDAFND